MVTSCDKWVFTLRLPGKIDGESVFQLRHSQPENDIPDLAEDKSDDKESNGTSAEEPERVRLLNGATSNGSGWTLTSPFWSLSSRNLLTVTYCPAWQALPEFTNGCCSCCTSCCGPCCSCTCSGIDPNGGRQFVAETFSVHDVQRVRKIDAVQVQGVGLCQGLQVFLRPMDSTNIPPVPARLQDAWKDHCERMNANPDIKEAKHEGPVLTFCLPKSHLDPPLLWRVELPSLDQAISVETISILDGKLLADVPENFYSPTHIYIHGFQSWSFSGSIAKGTHQPQPALPNVFSRAFNFGGSPPPVANTVLQTETSTTEPDLDEHQDSFYKSDFFTCITSDGMADERQPFPYQQLDETGGPALILGWLAQRQQFGVITSDNALEELQMHASAHGQILPGTKETPQRRLMTTDWAYAQLTTPRSYDEEPMAHYLNTTAAHNQARPLQNGPLLTGWCSWYVFYENISSQILRDNCSQLGSMRTHVPTNVAVVDDGYMTAWGDWDSLKRDAFPTGMEVVAQDIKANGMRPGIWLAPFAADKHSQLTKDHPDWIIRNNSGAAANSSNCGKWFYGLDATNPDVRQHVHDSIRRAVREWGYNVLKIDFLYAACLHGNGKYDLSMSRAQAMDLALSTIREAAGPNVFLIGCGCPIGSGIGFADAMRVSADTGPAWYPELPLPWWDHGTLPALRAMIRNSISRAPQGHRWWHNDPDCIMLGEHTRLNDIEVASAASVVAMTCGMLLLSDDLPKVDPKRMQIVSKIFPLTGIPAIVLDLHSTNDGLPSLMRLWCTDKFDLLDSFRESMSGDELLEDHNTEATFFARQASFNPDEEVTTSATERRRSCIHVTKGLGTWTVLSISNWLDKTTVVHIPPLALMPLPVDGRSRAASVDSADKLFGPNIPDENSHGYHTFAFWSGKYSWLPDQCLKPDGSAETISKKLAAHETEIYHIKPVTPEDPQYIGSSLHFSCGKEVRLFRSFSNKVIIMLDTTYHRTGQVYVFVPRIETRNLRVTLAGEPVRFDAVGNTPRLADNGSPRLVGRVVCIQVTVHADGREDDGAIRIEY